MEKLAVVINEVGRSIAVEKMDEVRIVVRGADNWWALYTDTKRIYVRTGQDSCSDRSRCHTRLPSVGDRMEIGQFNMFCVMAEHVDHNIENILYIQDGMLHLEERRGWDLFPFPED